MASSGDPACDMPATTALTITFVGVTVLLVLSIIPTVIQFSKNSKKQSKSTKSINATQRLKKIMDYAGYIMATLVVFAIIMHTFYVVDYCIKEQRGLDILSNFNVTLQAIVMLSLWFIRIKTVFVATQFEISKCATYTYVSIFVLLFILATVLSFEPLTDKYTKIGNIINQDRWWMGMAILALGYVCTLIALSTLFVYKLVMVYKNTGSDTHFVDLITKVTILNFTSVLFTLVMISTMAMYGIELYGRFINAVGIVLDYYTNFWCVMLSYRYFGAYYRKICGCVHVKCSDCWFKCIHRTERKTVLNMNSVNTKSVATSTSSPSSQDSAVI